MIKRAFVPPLRTSMIMVRHINGGHMRCDITSVWVHPLAHSLLTKPSIHSYHKQFLNLRKVKLLRRLLKCFTNFERVMWGKYALLYTYLQYAYIYIHTIFLWEGTVEGYTSGMRTKTRVPPNTSLKIWKLSGRKVKSPILFKSFGLNTFRPSLYKGAQKVGIHFASTTLYLLGHPV